MLVLIFCCWVTNYHKGGWWKQHDFMSSPSCRSEVQVGSLDPLLTGSTSRCWLGMAGLLSCKEPASQFIQVAGSVRLPVVVGLRSPFPCWPSVGHTLSSSRSLLLHRSICIKSFSYFEYLLTSCLPPAREISAFKGRSNYIGTTEITSLFKGKLCHVI